jgi:hypothetical protein
MTFTGPVVLDVCQHFVERWNEIKKRKVSCLPEYLRSFELTDFMCISIATNRKSLVDMPRIPAELQDNPAGGGLGWRYLMMLKMHPTSLSHVNAQNFIF